MRKTLLATTALAAAGMLTAGPSLAADKMSVGVSGYMQQWIGMSSVDGMDADGNAIDGGVAQQSDSEVWFKGKLEADNGLTFSVKVEIEGNTHPSPVDESQATVSGSFGQITLGAEDGASVLTHHGVRDVGFGINCGDLGAWINNIKGCGPGGFGTSGHGLGDKNNISYFSPRMSGVQLGVTYIPNVGQEAQAKPLQNNDMDAWSIGANYKGEVGDTSIAVSAGHYNRSQTMAPVALMSGMSGTNLMPLTAGALTGHMDTVAKYKAGRDLMKYKKEKTLQASTNATPNMAPTADMAATAQNAIAKAEDMEAFKAEEMTVSNFGLQVGLGSFSFDVAYMTSDGGAYKAARMDIPMYQGMWDHDGDEAQAAKDGTTPSPQVADDSTNNNPKNDIARSVLVKDTSKDFETVGFGVKYSDGPMAISLSHMMVEADDGAEQSGTMLSASYTLAPGVVSRTSLFAAERSGDAKTGSTEGAGFVTGITIGF